MNKLDFKPFERFSDCFPNDGTNKTIKYEAALEKAAKKWLYEHTAWSIGCIQGNFTIFDNALNS
jgi:hypothetical protein